VGPLKIGPLTHGLVKDVGPTKRIERSRMSGVIPMFDASEYWTDKTGG
jgi:hypothetical protein